MDLDREERRRLQARERARRWREKNREKIREQQRQWRENNRERYRERHRQWREENRERYREQQRQWRENNRERYKESQKQWAENNRERVRAAVRRWAEKNREYVLERKRRYRERLRAISRQMGQLGEARTASLMQNEIYAAVAQAVPKGIPGWLRDDVISEVVLEVLEGTAELSDVPVEAKKVLNRYRTSLYRELSLDSSKFEDAPDLIDTLTADSYMLTFGGVSC